MKSGRYEILPRVHFRHGVDELPWVCTWKDPGKLIQRKGQRLRYVNAYVGYGETMKEAIDDCRLAYAQHALKLQAASQWLDRNFNDEGEFVGERKPAPVHCIATSSLPWWRRLFRV